MLFQVVVKFLRKSSVIAGHWVQHKTMGLVPREISLLAHLYHPNIVQVRKRVDSCWLAVHTSVW